jgi:hypothetical protein
MLLFVLCDHITKKKQATGWCKNATGVEAKIRPNKRKRDKTKEKRK